MKWFLFYLALIFIDKKILPQFEWYQRYIAFMGGLGTKAARSLIRLFCKHDFKPIEWWNFDSGGVLQKHKCAKCSKYRSFRV